jgi:hypothetical protein
MEGQSLRCPEGHFGAGTAVDWRAENGDGAEKQTAIFYTPE